MIGKENLRTFGVVLGVLLVAEMVDAEDAKIQSALDIQGAWALVEWHHEGQVLRPPAIGGAYSLMGGQITWIVYRKTANGEHSEQCYGTYEISPDSFEYGYERCSEAVVDFDEVSFQAGPWSSPPFSVTDDDEKLVLIDEDGEFGFELVGDRLTYTQDGSPLRVYQRVN